MTNEGNIDENLKKFQKKLAGDQIIISGMITLACTVFAIGGALWVLELTVLDDLLSQGTTTITLTSNGTTIDLIANGTTIDITKRTIINIDTLNLITQIFLIFGLAVIVFGFSITMIFFNPKIKEKKKENCCTACGNILPCEIHENKHSPF